MTKNRRAKNIARTRAQETGEKYTTAHAATYNAVETNTQRLVALVRAGAERRYGHTLPTDVRKRLNFEMSHIKDAGVVDHYLTLHDIAQAARQRNILLSSGRGSSPGSAVLYSLGVTGVDPIKANLLFERFVAIGRYDFPDVAFDVQKSRTDQMQEYISSTYDAAQQDAVLHKVSITGSEPLNIGFTRDSRLDHIARTAALIEERTGTPIDVDSILAHSNLNDAYAKKTWEAIAAGDTDGCWFLESAGMKDFAVRAKPSSLSDLAGMVALYRPAPIHNGLFDLYVSRTGSDVYDYSNITTDPAERAVIASTLDETRGVWTYQEQVMRLGATVAGFNVAGTDKLRRAVAKNDPVFWAEMQDAFRFGAGMSATSDGTPKLSFSEETAANLLAAMQEHASSLFNASHAYATAQTLFAIAYLKANWPDEFTETA